MNCIDKNGVKFEHAYCLDIDLSSVAKNKGEPRMTVLAKSIIEGWDGW